MPAECKVLTCCDFDDFPQTSSSNGNCPVGYHWRGNACVVGPCIHMLYEDGTVMTDENGIPMCYESE